MRRPSEVYQEGYEKGRADNLAGHVSEAMLGMLRDDPDGHYGVGYRDGAAGKKFKPPPDNVRKAPAELNPFDDKVAIKTLCPNCSELDWFEWKFLGKLTDPVCGHTWYAGSGTYAIMQLRASFLAGHRYYKSVTSGVSMSGRDALIGKAFGWFIGNVLGFSIRLGLGLPMVPIQAIVGLCQPHKSNAEIVSRSIVIGVLVVGLGILVFEIQQDSMQSPRIQESALAQSPNVIPPIVSTPAPSPPIVSPTNVSQPILNPPTENPQSAPTPAALPQADDLRSSRLPVDLNSHCRSHGYAGARNKDGTGYGWVCTPGDVSISVEQACKEQYGDTYSVGLASPPPGGINDWFCHR